MTMPWAVLLVGLTATAPAGGDERPVSSYRSATYTFANDAPFRTDYYFTQGMSLSLVLPVLSHSPVNALLLEGPRGTTQSFAVQLIYDGFTPLRIEDPFIRYGDRPYASYLYASLQRMANDAARGQRLTSAIDVGFIGPLAGAKGFQTAEHQLLNGLPPEGWDFQIHDDAVLGYELAGEKRLAGRRFVELVGNARASMGTLRTFGEVGATLRAGWMSSYFADLDQAAGDGRLQLFATGQLEGRLVGYDATMEGGMFNRTSPYTLSGRQIDRAVAQATVSVVGAWGGVGLRASAVWLSPEFAGGLAHRWGQLAISVAF